MYRIWFAEQLGEYDIFTDIEFNEKRGLNCQARACAIFAYMLRMGCVDEYMVSMDEFAKVYDLVK